MDERIAAETRATAVVLLLHLIKVLEPNSRQKRTTAPPSLHSSAFLTCRMWFQLSILLVQVYLGIADHSVLAV